MSANSVAGAGVAVAGYPKPAGPSSQSPSSNRGCRQASMGSEASARPRLNFQTAPSGTSAVSSKLVVNTFGRPGVPPRSGLRDQFAPSSGSSSMLRRHRL